MYTENELLQQMSEQITDIIKEQIEYVTLSDWGTVYETAEEIEESVNDEIFQMINDSEYVIYTHNAEEISKTISLYDAFGTSDITGERFDNWSQVAFENLYAFIYNEIDVAELIETTLNNK